MDNLEPATTLLLRFVSIADPASAEECLEKLLTEHAEPIIRKITFFTLRFSAEEQDMEDVRSNAALHLLLWLRRLRQSSNANAIEDFSAYVARVAHNCCNELLRLKYPSRARLKNRIRYLLNHDSNLAIWQSVDGEWLCGLADWPKTQTIMPSTAQPSPKQDFIPSVPLSESITAPEMSALVRAFLTWKGGPASLNELVETLVQLLGISDVQIAAVPKEDQDTNICDILPDPRPDVAAQVELRMCLENLWKEVGGLPVRQRMALLLNLRDSQGRDALQLFVLTGIASVRKIAAVIEMPAENFALLWNDLPLADNTIADLLQVTRQQVINLRKSARERLARRMALH